MGVQILNKDVSVISSVMGKAKAGIGSIWGATGWSGGGADVTPNPTPNWTDVSYDGILGEYAYTTQQIQGINTSISLTVNYNNTLGSIYYYVGNTEPVINTSFPPSIQEDLYLQVTNGNGFSVTNNQYVSFGLESNAAFNGTVTVTIRNVSGGNIVLDTFSAINFNII